MVKGHHINTFPNEVTLVLTTFSANFLATDFKYKSTFNTLPCTVIPEIFGLIYFYFQKQSIVCTQITSSRFARNRFQPRSYFVLSQTEIESGIGNKITDTKINETPCSVREPLHGLDLK